MADTNVRGRDITAPNSEAEHVEIYNEPIGATRLAPHSDGATHHTYRNAVERDLDERGYIPAAVKRVSWGAILAGAVLAICVQTMLSFLGLAIGLGAVDPATEANPLGGMGVGAGIWLAVQTIIGFLIGGYVAGRLAGMPRKQDGTLHGIVTWGVVSLLTIYLMTSAVGRIVNSATGILGQGFQGITQVASNPAVANQAQQSSGQIQQELNQAQNQVQEQINQAQTPQGQQQLQQTADQAAATASSVALWAFVASLVGLIAAAIGGGMGTPKDLPATAMAAPATMPLSNRRL